MALLMDKRGEAMSASQIPGVMLAVVMTVSVLVFGLIIAQNMADTVEWKGTSATTGEAIVLNDTASHTLAQLYCIDGGTVTVVNATGGETIISANYTVTCAETGSSIIGVKEALGEYNNTAMTMNYTWYYHQDQWQGINQSIGEVGTFSNWWPILAIAIVASLVLGLLIRAIGGKTQV